jgi:PAS domain S-box-containing protein
MLNSADGALAINPQQQIVLWNEAAEVLMGFTAEEVLGRRCYEVMGGRDESGCLVCHQNCAGLMMALRQELVPTRDLLVRPKAGGEKWMSVSTVLTPMSRTNSYVLAHLFRASGRQKEMEQFVKQVLSNGEKLFLSPATDAPTTPPLTHPWLEPLTGREREVLRLLVSGASTKAIAGQLSISPFTARNHIRKILAKLQVHSRLEAVTLGLRTRLI